MWPMIKRTPKPKPETDLENAKKVAIELIKARRHYQNHVDVLSKLIVEDKRIIKWTQNGKLYTIDKWKGRWDMAELRVHEEQLD